MAYTYDKQLWKDYPDTTTPITADRLNHMEDGIKGLSDAQVSIEVVDSLDGDSTTNPPSVHAVKSGIMESGNNDNGNYIKYYDGTLICYGDKYGITTLSSYWNQFKKGQLSVTFPQTFTSAPSITISSINTEYYAQLSFGADSITVNGFTAKVFKPNSAVSTGVNFSYIAIGKWK